MDGQSNRERPPVSLRRFAEAYSILGPRFSDKALAMAREIRASLAKNSAARILLAECRSAFGVVEQRGGTADR